MFLTWAIKKDDCYYTQAKAIRFQKIPHLASFPGLPTRASKKMRKKRGEAWSILSRVRPQGRRQVDVSNSIERTS